MVLHPLNQPDLFRAYQVFKRLGEQAHTPTTVRRTAERMLMKSAPDSYRYAFWRLVLAFVVADEARLRHSRRTRIVAAGSGGARLRRQGRFVLPEGHALV
ncbi:MAG: hypothetical protein GY842_03395 [bacterium]|nr:hypothetical protein [bacterium]